MGSTILRSHIRLRTPYRLVKAGLHLYLYAFAQVRSCTFGSWWSLVEHVAKEITTAIRFVSYRTGKVLVPYSDEEGRECGLMTYALCAAFGAPEFSLHSSVSVSLRVLR